MRWRSSTVAPTPELGRALSRSKIASALRRGGRQRNVERRADEIQEALRAEHLEAPELITAAYGLDHPLGRRADRTLQRPDRRTRGGALGAF